MNCTGTITNGKRCDPQEGSGTAPLRRSVLDYGARGDGVTDDLAAFDRTAQVVSDEGGGEIYVPRSVGGFLLVGTFVLPPNCFLVGEGEHSVVLGRPTAGNAAIQLAPGTHEGGIVGIYLAGNAAAPTGLGISLAGVQWATVRDCFVWHYEVGLRFSDGTPYCGYCHAQGLQVNSCHVGVQALDNTNSCSLEDARIFNAVNGGAGVGLDIVGGDVFDVQDLTIEPCDVGVRARGLVRARISGLYVEPGAGVPWDIDVDADSQLRGETIFPSANASVALSAGLEDPIVWDAVDNQFFGGRRHYAASPAQNLIENGNLHRANSVISIPGWFTIGAPILAQNLVDYFTARRSYDVTQNAGATDGFGTSARVPDGVQYVTAIYRFKNFDSAGATATLTSGANQATAVDRRPPDGGAEWRYLTVTVAVDPAANGLLSVSMAADATASGGHIRVDEYWAVSGRCAGPSRLHGHRLEFLTAAVNSIVDRNGIVATDAFGPVNLAALTGLAQPPLGAIGAILRLRATVTHAPTGELMTGVPLPRIFLLGGIQDELQPVLGGIQTTRILFVRSMSISGGLNVIGGVCDPTDYDVDLLGWILPN